MMEDYTPEQIAAMHNYNESFVGRTANLAKMRHHQDIKAGLINFMEMCDHVHKVEEFKPNKCKQNSLVFVDLRHPTVLDKVSASMMAKIMEMADSVVISADTDYVRVSFATEKIWTD